MASRATEHPADEPIDMGPEHTAEATPDPEGEVPVAAHVRRPPGTAPSPSSRIADLEAELLRLQLAIVQTNGDMTGAHLNAAREYVQGVLDDVVDGKRKLTRELADHLAKQISPSGRTDRA